MKSILLATLLLLSFSSMSAEIKKISETEFEFHSDDGKIKKIITEHSMGTVEYIAALQQAESTRFLIRTGSGLYLQHQELPLNSSPEANALLQLAQNTRFSPSFNATAGSMSGVAFSLLPRTLNVQRGTKTTPLSDVQRSTSSNQVIITPDTKNKSLLDRLRGHYNILKDAQFHRYGKSDTVFSF